MARAYVYEDDATGWRTFINGDLPTSGVTAATYGDATHVAQVAVNAQGIVTSASNVAITGSGVTSLDSITGAVSLVAGSNVTITDNSPGAGQITIASTGGSSSPLTTKGDVFGHSTVDARIPVGSDGQVLTADSAASLGVSWAAVPSPGGVGTVQVGTTVGGLTTGNGNLASLRTGSSPYDFLMLVYDSTYAHWVSEVFMGLTADATGGSTTSASYVGTASSFQHGPPWPEGNYINAGLTLQLRVTGLGSVAGGGTGSVSATITGYNVAGADSVTLTAGTVAASTASASRVGIDSGWVSVTPSATTDLMRFGLSVKTTAGTFSYLQPGVLFRWIG